MRVSFGAPDIDWVGKKHVAYIPVIIRVQRVAIQIDYSHLTHFMPHRVSMVR